MYGQQANSYFNSYSSLEPDTAVKINGDGRTLSAPDIARNNAVTRGASSAARKRMADRMFPR